jgi:hypothetical protein
MAFSCADRQASGLALGVVDVDSAAGPSPESDRPKATNQSGEESGRSARLKWLQPQWLSAV